jgi:hypothetical protein
MLELSGDAMTAPATTDAIVIEAGHVYQGLFLHLWSRCILFRSCQRHSRDEAERKQMSCHDSHLQEINVLRKDARADVVIAARGRTTSRCAASGVERTFQSPALDARMQSEENFSVELGAAVRVGGRRAGYLPESAA